MWIYEGFLLKVFSMYYDVFPFGKYKGVKLKDLPSTYIVLALEKFDLPIQLTDEMGRILLGRMSIYSNTKHLIETIKKDDLLTFYSDRIKDYEKL